MLFAGGDILSKAFGNYGWHIGLPLDVKIDVDLFLINPLYFDLFIGLTLNGRSTFL